MAHLRKVLATLGLVLSLAGCTSQELGTLVQVGAKASGESDEEAAKYGQTAQTMGEAVLPIEYETERAIGGGVAVKAFEVYGDYYDDPEMHRYVTLVGKAVAAKSPRPDLPYAFAILSNDTPNAFAGPGGYIFVTVGTLKACVDEAQLAGVLAHEVSHVCRRHALKTLQRAKLLEGVAQGASIADPQNSQQYSTVVGALDETLFQRGLDQPFEFEADIDGTDIAAAAGYNPWGLREFVGQLAVVQASGKTGGWFQTHPSISERLSRLDSHLVSYGDFRTLPRAAERFKLNVADRLKAAGR